MAQDCLLLPYSGVDLGLVDKLAETLGSGELARCALCLRPFKLKLTAKSVNQAA